METLGQSGAGGPISARSSPIFVIVGYTRAVHGTGDLMRTGLTLVLLGTATLLAVTVCEVAIRAVYPMPERGYGVWAAYPGSTLTLISEPDGFVAEHRYNRYGFRGPDFPPERQSDIRVACVGDSYTEGVGAEEHESWPMVLAQRLAGRGWEVLNLGDSGSQFDGYARIIGKVAVPADPTDIVVSILPGDLRYGPDLPPGLAVTSEFDDPLRTGRAGFARIVAQLLPGWTYLVNRRSYPVQRGLMWATLDEPQIRESAVRDVAMRIGVSPPRARKIVQARLDMVSDSLLDASARGRFNGWLIRMEMVEPFLLYRSTISDLRVEETDLRESTGDWLRWYSALCAELDIRPWLVYFPAAPLVQPGPWGTFEDRHYEQAPDVLGDRSVAAFLEGLCREHGIYTGRPKDQVSRWLRRQSSSLEQGTGA
jgi:hypothetical protein